MGRAPEHPIPRRTQPCPFAHCRNPDTVLVEVEIEDLFTFAKVLRSWRVSCPKCGALGPWGGSGDNGKDQATRLWNNRVRD